MNILFHSSSNPEVFSKRNSFWFPLNFQYKKIGLSVSIAFGFLTACYVWKNSSCRIKLIDGLKQIGYDFSAAEKQNKKDGQISFKWILLMMAIAKAKKRKVVSSIGNSNQDKTHLETRTQAIKSSKTENEKLETEQNGKKAFSEQSHKPEMINFSHQQENLNSKSLVQVIQNEFNSGTIAISSPPSHDMHHVKKEDPKPNKNRSEKICPLDITLGKSKALTAYKANPDQCNQINKTIIFKDIKQIKSLNQNYNRVDSIVDLMLYLSDLNEINLHNAICARVIVDTIKEGDKDTSLPLVEWLSREETFHVNLLRDCLQAFIERNQKQLPFNLYALEKLMRIYKDKSWHQLCNSQQALILPSHHPLVSEAMTILIKSNPYNDKIRTLASE